MPQRRKEMSLTKLAYWFLGGVFLLFGINGYLHIIPLPVMQGPALTFMTGLMSTGYFIHLLKLTEIVCGALLIIGMYVPLILVILAPIVLNILLFHLFLAPTGLFIALLITVAYLYLVWRESDTLGTLLK